MTSAILRRLSALNLAPEAMAEVLSIFAAAQAEDEDRLRNQRERKARSRQVHVTGQSQDKSVTVTVTPSPKEIPPTPPKETTSSHLPPIPSDKSSGMAPKGAGHTFEEAFGQFKVAFPKRKGSNPWEVARKRFKAALANGEDVERIILGARRYAIEQNELGHLGTEFVAQAGTWLNQKRWLDYQGAPAELGARAPPAAGLPSSEELLRRYTQPQKTPDDTGQQESDQPGPQGVLRRRGEVHRFGEGVNGTRPLLGDPARRTGMVGLGDVFPMARGLSMGDESGRS